MKDLPCGSVCPLYLRFAGWLQKRPSAVIARRVDERIRATSLERARQTLVEKVQCVRSVVHVIKALTRHGNQPEQSAVSRRSAAAIEQLLADLNPVGRGRN